MSDHVVMLDKLNSCLIRNAAAISILLLLSACATQSFLPAPIDPSGFVKRGIVQSEGLVEVTAAVPTADEVSNLFGVDLYADGVQPVWLRVENRGDKHVRVALFSIDSNYFPPLEVAWNYRKRFVKSSRTAMDRWFLETALPRYVPAGESRSGFVYTHASEGTKGFFVDIYSATGGAESFTYFVPLPGFEPDYMQVNFQELYPEDEVFVGDLDALRYKLSEIPCCTTDESGEQAGDPLNVVIVGSPDAVRTALLRGMWQETELGSPKTRLARQHQYRGRPPDGTFIKERPDGSERKELRLWLAPMLIDDMTVWLGSVSYDMSGSTLGRNPKDYTIDPDIDDARMFLLQNFWYSQSLQSLAMATGIPATTIDSPRTNFSGAEYFTDGLRAVLVVSKEPVALDDTQILVWESLNGK